MAIRLPKFVLTLTQREPSGAQKVHLNNFAFIFHALRLSRDCLFGGKLEENDMKNEANSWADILERR